jgi:hypothetical protein
MLLASQRSSNKPIMFRSSSSTSCSDVTIFEYSAGSEVPLHRTIDVSPLLRFVGTSDILREVFKMYSVIGRAYVTQKR